MKGNLAAVFATVMIITLRCHAAPTVSAIPNQRIFPGFSTKSLDFKIGDSDFPPDSLSLIASSSNAELVPTNSFFFSGAGTNRGISITPSQGIKGTAIISIQVRNPDGISASNSFQLTVGDFSDIAGGFAGIGLGALCWVDYDNDGDLDLFVSGRPSAGGGVETWIYRNDGSGIFTKLGVGLPAMDSTWADWADVDNDGYADVAMSGRSVFGHQTTVNRNLGDGQFAWWGSMGAWSEGPLAWGDYDTDGKQDLAVTGYSFARLYRNAGYPGWVDSGINLEPAAYGSVAWADYNGDGYPDLFMSGNAYGLLSAKLYKNSGGFLTNSGAPFLGLDTGVSTWKDYNNDNRPDLFTMGRLESGQRIARLYGNYEGVLTNVATQISGLASSLSAWGDYDNDGKIDLFVSGYDTAVVARVYRNLGSDAFVQADISLPGLFSGCAAWGDYDNDGALDLAIMGFTNSVTIPFLKVFHNDGAMPNTAPNSPVGLTVILGPNSAQLSWSPATDNEQNGGLSYNVRIGTSPSGINIVSPLADVATGFRRVASTGNAGYRTNFPIRHLGGGTYYWSVQTIDHAYKGSMFAAEASFTLPAPIITNQPQSQTVNSGMPVTFVVGAIGVDPKFYQWLFNGVSIGAATNEALTIDATQFSDQGVYSVIISNAYGNAVSTNASLTVLSPPSFAAQPVSQTNRMGSYANFYGAALGSLPISYRWYFNGSPLTNEGDYWGASSNRLTIFSVVPADAGMYSVVASNAYGFATSTVASLSVQSPTALLNVDFGIGTHSLKLGQAAIGITAGDFWNFYDATNAGLTNLLLAQQVPTLTRVIVDGPRAPWTNSNPDPMFKSYLYQNGSPGVLRVTAEGLPAGNYDFIYYGRCGDVLEGSGFELFIDGISKGSRETGGSDVTGTIGVNSTNWIEGVHYALFTNVVIGPNSSAQVAVSGINSACISAVIAGMQICPALAQPQVPLYWIHPKSGAFPPGSNFLLEANVTGQSEIQYQWFRNGLPLTNDTHLFGVNSNALAVISSSTNQTGNYWLVATNSFGMSTSMVANVFVGLPPTIVSNPVSKTNILGSNVTFTVAVDGTPPFSYRWRKNGANLSDGGRLTGAFTATLVITNIQSADAAQYSVVVTNGAGSITSAAGILTVIVPPSITVQPQSKIALGGSNVTLTAFASGTTPLTYQWIKNGEKIASATLFSLLLPSVRRTNSGSYALIVTNVGGSITSATANLTVHVPQRIEVSLDSNDPVFTSHDADGGRLNLTNLSQFRLQTSSNLLQWVTVSNALSLTNGELRVTLPVGSNQMQFYRIFELW